MSYLIIAIAPVFALLAFVYFRDKYEKEPIGMILKGILFGVIIIFPVGFIEEFLIQASANLSPVPKAAWDGFIVAGFTEELFKYLVVFLLFFRNRNFNERYDGIVYAVAVSLGFAGIENIFYVYKHGAVTGLLRAFTAVPAHMIMGIVMGYYFGLARFIPVQRSRYLFLALLIPVLIHGFYDFILMSQHPLLLVLFIPVMVLYWRFALKKMKQHQRDSAFNPASADFTYSQKNGNIPPPLPKSAATPPPYYTRKTSGYNQNERN